jgi:hypothetical protein
MNNPVYIFSNMTVADTNPAVMFKYASNYVIENKRQGQNAKL